MESISTIAHSLATRPEHTGRRSPRDFADTIEKSGAKEKVVDSHRPTDVAKQSSEDLLPSENLAGTTGDNSMQAPHIGEVERTVPSTPVRPVEYPVGHIDNIDDARVYGVHLLAGRYLSQLGSGASSALPRVDMAATDVEIAAQLTFVAALPGQASLDPRIEAVALPEASPVPVLPKEAERAIENPSYGQECSEVAFAMSSSQEWLERSLRFAKGQDGDSVAWVRDFRMNEQQAGVLVSDLLGQAKANGVALARIMLNGHAIWNSTKEV